FRITLDVGREDLIQLRCRTSFVGIAELALMGSYRATQRRYRIFGCKSAHQEGVDGFLHPIRKGRYSLTHLDLSVKERHRHQVAALPHGCPGIAIYVK